MNSACHRAAGCSPNLEQAAHKKPPLNHRRDLEGSERVLGPDHPDTLVSLNNLAVLLQAQGKLEEAEPLYRCEGCGRGWLKCIPVGGPVNALTGRLEGVFCGLLVPDLGSSQLLYDTRCSPTPWSHPSERAAHVHTCSTPDATLLPPCCCAGARSKPRSAFWVHTTPAPSQVWRRWQGYCRQKGSCRKLSGCTGASHGDGPHAVSVTCRPGCTAPVASLSLAFCATTHHIGNPGHLRHTFSP